MLNPNDSRAGGLPLPSLFLPLPLFVFAVLLSEGKDPERLPPHYCPNLFIHKAQAVLLRLTAWGARFSAGPPPPYFC
jgi:hypothetical protein